MSKIFTDVKVIKLFRESRVTGAHIFNSVKMLKLRMDLLKINVELDAVYNELSKEIKTIDKIRKADYLSDKLNSDRKSIGFGENEEYENEEMDEAPSIDETGGDSRRSPRSKNKRLTKEEATDLVIGGLFKEED